MADTEKDVNRAAAAPQEEASAAQAAPEAPQPETQDAEKTEKKEKHAEGKAHAELAALKNQAGAGCKKAGRNERARCCAPPRNMKTSASAAPGSTMPRSDNGVSFAVGTRCCPCWTRWQIAADAPTADESYKKGVTDDAGQMPARRSAKWVSSEIEAQGKPFDPELHAAVLQQPSTDDMPSGTVTQVMQKGYLLHDKVIRHAAVAVAE